MLLVLVARAAWADPVGCSNPWDSVTPQCMVRRAGGALASSMAGTIAEGVSWLAKQIGDGARTAGRPDLNQSWFSAAMVNTRELAVLFAVVGMLLSVIYAALKRDLAEIGRTLARVLAAGLTTGGVTLVVAAANNLVDNLCDYVLGPRGWAAVTDALRLPVAELGRMIGSTDPVSTMTTPPVIAVLVGVLMLIALAVIWCELLIRRIVIDLCVLFWPLAVSGAVWANARLWTRRLVDTITGFVLSKLLIIVILRFAADAFSNMNSVSDLIVAVGVYAIAAVAPFWVMRLIGFFGGAIQPSHTGEGLRGAAVGAAVAGAMTVARLATSVSSGGGTAAVGAAAGAGGAGKTAGGVLGGGRTPMPNPKRPAQAGKTGGAGRTGFTPGGRPAATGGDAKPGAAQGDAASTGSRGAPSGDGERTRQVPEPPPMPRAYPGKPVPPHLRPASSSGASATGAEKQTGSTGGTTGTPPASGSGAAQRPAVRRPDPWPQPRRGDPSAPMRWPQLPPAPPPRSEDD